MRSSPIPESGGSPDALAAGRAGSLAGPGADSTTPGGDDTLFDAVLTPHRSLSPGGFVVLMSLIGLVGIGIGIAFVTIGAWPVFGFCGAEVALIWLCFHLSYRSGRSWERVRLTARSLTVERHRIDGSWHEWRFQPYWLRVLMDDPPQHESRLVLTSHGESLAIGSFLTPEERLDLAKALRRALETARETARETPTG